MIELKIPSIEVDKHREEIESFVLDFDLKSEEITDVSELIKSTRLSSVLESFVEGSTASFNPDPEKALMRLNSDSWNKLFQRLDLYTFLDSNRSSEWKRTLVENDAPPFISEIVRTTLLDLQRIEDILFAERIVEVHDEVHHTFPGQGFASPLVFEKAVESFEFGFISLKVRDSVARLRHIILSSVFGDTSNRNEVHHTTYTLLKEALVFSDEMPLFIDGNTMGLRVNELGTLFVYIHPLVAYQLNRFVELIRPNQINPAFLHPSSDVNELDKIVKPLPASILAALSGAWHGTSLDEKNRYDIDYRIINLPSELGDFNEVDIIMRKLGGIRRTDVSLERSYMFAMDPLQHIREVVITGQLCYDGERKELE